MKAKLKEIRPMFQLLKKLLLGINGKNIDISPALIILRLISLLVIKI